MAKLTKSRDQKMGQEERIITELLTELQAIEEWRQYAVRFHTLVQQHCHLEIPVQ